MFSNPVPIAHSKVTPRFVRADLLVLVLTAAVLIVFRLHAFDLPLETDECNYAYIGGRLLGGDRLYVDVWDHQPPGVFALFAGVISVFGDTPHVFRWLATAASLVTLVCLYGWSLRAFGRTCAVCSAIVFAIVSSDPGTAGEGCNREIFMNALIASAWYFVMMTDRPRLRHFLAAGLALGFASVIKTVVAVHWMFLAIAIVIEALRPRRCDTSSGDQPASHEEKPASDLGASRYRAKRPPLRFGDGQSEETIQRSKAQSSPSMREDAPRATPRTDTVFRELRSVFALGIGPALIWFTVFVYFGATARLAEFYDAVFRFNIGYSGGAGGFFHRFVAFFFPHQFPFLFDSAMALWLVAAVAVVLMIVPAVRGHRACAAILAWLVGAYIAACLPGRFWPHYYYLLVPPACIAASWCCCRLVRFFHGPKSSAPVLRVAACSALALLVFAGEYHHYLGRTLFGITVTRYNSRDFWGKAQGENIRRVTSPDDKVFVYGNEASLYYYAHRRCASRYTMITGIAEGMEGAEQRRRIMMDELRADPPRLMVVLFDEPPFPQWKTFLAEFYGEPVGWDFHDKTHKPIMFVVARKDNPIASINWDWDRSSVGGWQLGERER